MASGQPQQCCASGFMHKGNTTGEIIQINPDVKAYVSGDKTSDKVLLFFTDVFGCEFINAQIVADNYAAKGYYVVAPDLFYGEALKPNDPITMEYIGEHGLERTEPAALAGLQYIKEVLKPKFIATLGHCFGGKYAIRLLDGRVDAGAVAHPSLVEMSEIEAIKKPLLICGAETDPVFTDQDRYNTELKLKEMKATYFVTLLSGVQHGFAVRGDPDSKWTVTGREKVFNDSIWWFSLFQ